MNEELVRLAVRFKDRVEVLHAFRKSGGHDTDVERRMKGELKEIGWLVFKLAGLEGLHLVANTACESLDNEFSRRMAFVDSALNGIGSEKGGYWVS